MNQPEFKAFPKIPRLNREVVVTEKIDGTNACVYIGEDGTVLAGSRNRWLSPAQSGVSGARRADTDNYGFAEWVAKHQEELRSGLGTGTHWGEWWGSGIQRNYGLNERRFSLFNVAKWSDPDVRPSCCHVVPELARGFDIRAETDRAIEMLRSCGSVAAPGFTRPEGVVIFHVVSGNLFKVTLEHDQVPKAMVRIESTF